MITIIEGFQNNVLAVSATGKITGKDYETVLIPAVEQKLKVNKKLRMLYQLDRSYTDFEPSAMMDDAKIGMKHLFEWEKVALVSDHKMINAVAKFFGYLMTCEVSFFKNADLEKAKKWIVEK